MKAFPLVCMAAAWCGLTACRSADPKYYTLAPDSRDCAQPACGGYFLRQVNAAQTPCADGSMQDVCHAGRLELRNLSLSSPAEAELRANPTNFLLRGVLGRQDDLDFFTASEAWQVQAQRTPTGTFYHVKDNGIVCVAFPCPSYAAEPLNTGGPQQTLADVRLGDPGLDLSAVTQQLRQPEGGLLAGTLLPVSGPAGASLALQASAAYLPFRMQSIASCDPRSQCPAGQYCLLPGTDPCSLAASSGLCKERPQFCMEIYDPVCGCDGQTYGNGCQAASHGMNVAHKGACSPGH